jgi:hypothetical protein
MAGNTILTIDQITRESVELFRNSNAFLMNVDRQFDEEFGKSGQKIGEVLRVRLPNDYTVRSGPALNVQSTSEIKIPLAVATQKGVDIAFTTAERTMSLQDYSRRVLAPAINNLVGQVAADVMSGAEGICNYVANVDGSNNVLTPTMETWSTANAYLDMNSAPMGNRLTVTSPISSARAQSSFSGLFNPSQRITEQYESGAVFNGLGSDWVRDQTVLAHTAGTFSAGGTVNGGGQTGSTITVNAITGTLKKGDIVTFDGVYAVNRVTKASTGQLRQFSITADVASGATSIPIYPALTPAVGGQQVQYQTVDASPINGAAMTLVSKPGEVTRKNFVFAPQAVTFAMAELEEPRGVHEVAVITDDKVSIRILTAYIPTTDQMVTRLDVLYGYVWPRYEWGCIVADKL